MRTVPEGTVPQAEGAPARLPDQPLRADAVRREFGVARRHAERTVAEGDRVKLNHG